MQTFPERIQDSPARNPRSAVAAVELAIVLPVLMALVLGVVESCNLIYLKQSLTISAYEGARAAIVKGMIVSDINDRSDQILADRKITNATILVSPNPPSTASYGTYITVRVQAPYAANSLIPGWLFGGVTLQSTVKMMKEY